MIQGIAWLGDCHEILKKDQIEFPLEALGTHGDRVLVFVGSLVLLFSLLFVYILFVILSVFGARTCHFVCGVLFLLFFHGLLLVCFLFLPFMF